MSVANKINCLSVDSATLLAALQIGTVKNAGGVLVDCRSRCIPLGFSQLYFAVQELLRFGCDVQRIDSGGAPEWMLMPNVNE